ncbi:MAG: tetratricopeptide repeat protein [Nitrospira sp.]|nr:tetratricopeptide repeat protein [Nitrospira sp.]HNP30653.1 tetratricopeptide repeat protein [Nitrospirales bacterium]
MRSWRKKMRIGGFLIMMIMAGGCASNKPVPLAPLAPPPNVDTQVLQLMTEGKRSFDEGRWEAARQQFQAAVQQQADLAEAHYNLALSMDKMGDQAGAKKHYIEAANLAPGHKVIWNSPPLRRYGNVPDAPVQATSAPVMPGFGGGASPGGGGMGY